MTSRERLLGAISRTRIDRVPISTYELCGWNSRAFENNQPSYDKLMAYIRENTDCIAMWNPGVINAQKHETTQMRDSNVTRRTHTLNTPSGRVLTARDVTYDDVVTTWRVERYCKTTGDVDALMGTPFEPAIYDDSDYARISAEVGDKGIIMTSVADAACEAMEMMEFGEATVWCMTETEHFAGVIKELHRRAMINLENMLHTRTVDLYRICGPEYLTPPYLPPAMFERFVAPNLYEMISMIHAYGAKARVHCHGKVGRVLDMILETKADGIDPCEAPPDGDITLSEIKARVGERMCIFGNLQLKLLEHGSTSEVKNAVKQCMAAAQGDTGYVIMPTAGPINLPLCKKTAENYMAFIDEAGAAFYVR